MYNCINYLTLLNIYIQYMRYIDTTKHLYLSTNKLKKLFVMRALVK